MYKTRPLSYFREALAVPDDYLVSGFLSCGTWNEQEQFGVLLSVLDGLGVKYETRTFSRFWSKIHEIKIGGKFYWFSVLYGGAMLSEYTHVASILGSTMNIHIGSCGGLYKEMDSLDFLIPTWSYGNDSVTRIYSRESVDHKHFANKELSYKLKALISPEQKVWEGPVMTCQAMIGETWEDVESWSNDGYFGVEMETSTMFAVSNHLNVPSASLMYVSDNLIKGQLVNDESHKNEKELREKLKVEMFKVAVKVLLNKPNNEE